MTASFENPDDVYHSFKDLLVFCLIYTVIYFCFVWWSLLYIFLIPINWGLSAIAFAGALVPAVPGTYLSCKLGTKVNSLIN